MKTTIVMITGTYQLLQALWYASAYPENRYIAVIKDANTNPDVKKNIKQLCERSGVFSQILMYSGTSIDSSGLQKAWLMLRMMTAYALGRREKLTKKMIRAQIGNIAYDQVVVDSEHSILGGAFVDHADETDTVIMQEGLSDILERTTKLRKGKGELISYMLARMGYCSPAFVYPLKKAHLCKKMCSMQNLLKYRDYAQLIPVFSDCNPQSFQEKLRKTYHVSFEEIQQADIILVTAPMNMFSGGEVSYEAVRDWLQSKYKGKKILVKKHPRDFCTYDWQDLSIYFCDAEIPAELILSRVSPEQKVLFMYISTCIVDILDRDVNYRVFRFSGIEDKEYPGLFRYAQEQLKIGEDHIVVL